MYCKATFVDCFQVEQPTTEYQQVPSTGYLVLYQVLSEMRGHRQTAYSTTYSSWHQHGLRRLQYSAWYYSDFIPWVYHDTNRITQLRIQDMSHCSCALRHNLCSLSKQHILILHYSTVRFVQSWMYGGKKYADCPQQKGRWIFLQSYSISHTRTPFLYTKRSIFCGIDEQASLLSVGTMMARSALCRRTLRAEGCTEKQRIFNRSRISYCT